MKINNQTHTQLNSQIFGARKISPKSLKKAPYASVPLSLGALATLGMAKLLLDSKPIEKIPTPEEIEEAAESEQND